MVYNLQLLNSVFTGNFNGTPIIKDMKTFNSLFIAFLIFSFTSCLQSKKSNFTNDLKSIDVDVARVTDYYDISPDVEIDWGILSLETSDYSLISYIDRIIFENDRC